MSFEDLVGFPCTAIPQQPAAARLLGLYPQNDGRWLQRIKLLGGRLTGQQWRRLAELSAEFAAGLPLHLTTRQDIELHDLSAEAVPAVQRGLAEVGLSGGGACGDTLRNITVCPCSGIMPDCADLAPLAWLVRESLEAMGHITALPRKFKISFSACRQACGQPWINDLGLILEKPSPHGDRRTFRVVAGGSLGPRPATGIPLAEGVDADDVLPLAVAAVQLFYEQGDRENRARARLRHVRERLGDEQFAAELRTRWQRNIARGKWPSVSLPQPARPLTARVALTFPGGQLELSAADALAALADDAQIQVRIANQHRVYVFGPHEQFVRHKIMDWEQLHRPARPQPAIVACPGSRWCARGLTDTAELARRLREELGDCLDSERVIAISGCPNNCAQSAVADIGLVGGLASDNGRRYEAYRLLAGGGMGRSAELAKPAGSRLSVQAIADQIKQKI